jgi:wyosine [tRNA(Phe)-imidazoG37] synthetase (radical SAM superfamily)
MKFVFGPVPSRRLGQSLGIDPIPLKTCNWNCVYCQLGRTIPLTNKREMFFPPEEIFAQVKEALLKHKPGEIDWITFVGSGETMLYLGIKELISEIKKMTNIPVAVITNGSLLYLPEVREELLEADAVLPSLDAGNEHLYKKINRPHPEVTFSRLVEGMKQFRKEYSGKLWVEVMLIKGLNDNEQALREIAALLAEINPDEVHILQPTRPPVETWVEPSDEEGLERARRILGKIARVIDPSKGSFDLGEDDDLTDAIIDIITRHPMKETEIIDALSKHPQVNIQEALHLLETSGKAQVVIRYGVRYWSALPSFYPEEKK